MRHTVYTARQIMAVIQPLLGARSSGTATVSATAGNITLKKNAQALPIVPSASGTMQLDPSRPVRVAADTIVTSAGVAVPVTSLLGGPAQNLPLTTTLRWDPPLDGIELVSPLASALTGATQAVGPGSIKRLVLYEGVGPSSAQRDLFLAKAGHFPAVILNWDSTGEGEKVGNGVIARPDRWVLTIVTSRSDAGELRAMDGLDIKDALEVLLADRAAVDGEPFSAPGIALMGARRVDVSESSYIYTLMLETYGAVQRTDTRVWNDWLLTRYDFDTPDTPPYPVVDDARHDMDPDTPPPFP